VFLNGCTEQLVLSLLTGVLEGSYFVIFVTRKQ